jgi:hypothetical protein
MSFNPGMIQAIAGASSTLVALAALITAFQVERRNQKRFAEQLRQSRELAQAHIRPLLTISSQGYEDLKSVRLVNRGAGYCDRHKGGVLSRGAEDNRSGGSVSNPW